MKKIGLVIGASAAAFLIGLLGLYALIPQVLPEHAKHARGDTLSQSTVDSLIQARVAAAREDSVQAIETAALDIIGLTPDSLDTLRHQAERMRTLEDSLETLAETIAETERRQDSLSAALTEAKARSQKLEESDQTAEEISKAFTQIENNEMGDILAHVHPTVLRKLYEKASARDRARILRALSPNQAARFLEGLVDPSLIPDSLQTGTALASDSTAIQTTDS